MTDLRILTRCLLPLILAFSVAACNSSRTYATLEPGEGSSRSQLELPPDLVSTSSDNLVTNQNAQPEEVLPEPEGLNVQRNDEEGWIEVDAPADRVWRNLVSQWNGLGIELAVANPKAGIMETDWVRPGRSERQDEGPITTVVDDLLDRVLDSPTALDKYTVRLEKLGEGRTRIHVSHQGAKKIQTQKGGFALNDQYEWVETEDDPEKISRVMSLLVSGLEGAEAS